LVDAVKSMTVTDAKAILTGGDDPVTKLFAGKTRAPLSERFLPIVRQTTEKIALAQHDNGWSTRPASCASAAAAWSVLKTTPLTRHPTHCTS